MNTTKKEVAIFGATGYVGLILVNRLIKENISLKLFIRNKRRLRYLKEQGNFCSCDIPIERQNEDVIADELAFCDVVYYLIHSMSPVNDSFEDIDNELARVVAAASEKAGIRQIIYLGGLGIEKEGHPLSSHLKSRQITGEMLRSTGVSVTEIRAGVIIGAGSVSFEMIRALALKLPFIPELAYNKGLCQPVDIDDVVSYLFHVYLHPVFMGQIIEVGMDEAYGYDEMITLFAKHGKHRRIYRLSLPYLEYIFTKNLVVRIISFLSAVPYEVARPLVEGMDSLSIKGEYAYESIHTSCPLTVDISRKNALINGDFNVITPLSFLESIKKASNYEREGRVESYWSVPLELQVLSKEKEKFLYTDHYEKNGLLFEKRVRTVQADDVEKIFGEVKKIGGDHGYWSPQWMWSIRALSDKLMGGPGLDTGRRMHEHETRIGERIDFWVVTDYLDIADKKVLTLKARLKSPGNSWLQFALIREEKDHTAWKFMLRAYFEPFGLLGYAYWYSLFFVHKYIFTKMIDTIIEEALGSDLDEKL